MDNIIVRFKEVRYARIRKAPYLGLNMDSPMSAECPPELASRPYKGNCPLKSSEVLFSTDFKNGLTIVQQSFNNCLKIVKKSF